MGKLNSIQSALRSGLTALKAAWMRWNEHEIDAAGDIFQNRVDPISGQSQYARMHPIYYV